jgi:hypothetical protein
VATLVRLDIEKFFGVALLARLERKAGTVVFLVNGAVNAALMNLVGTCMYVC